MGLGWVREANQNQNGINSVESFGDINKYMRGWGILFEMFLKILDNEM